MELETLPAKPDLNKIFQYPTASEALNIIYCVGVITASLSKRGRSIPRSKTLEDAKHALTDWPNQFNNIVDRIAGSSDLQESNQIFRIFDQTAGHNRLASAHAGILRDAIFLAAGRGPTRGPSSASAQNVATSPQKFVTQIAAARLLDVTNHTVRKLFHKGQIGGYLKTGKTGNDYLFLDMEDLLEEKARRDNIADIRSKRESYLSINEIYELFGILPRYLCDFEGFGLISRSPQQEGGLYVRQSVEELFRRLAEKCQYKTGRNAIDKEVITLKKIFRRFDVPLIDVIQSILESV